MVLCSNGGPGWWLDPVLSISFNLESGHTWDHGTLYSLLEFLVKSANVSTSTIPSGQSAACNEAGAALVQQEEAAPAGLCRYPGQPSPDPGIPRPARPPARSSHRAPPPPPGSSSVLPARWK